MTRSEHIAAAQDWMRQAREYLAGLTVPLSPTERATLQEMQAHALRHAARARTLARKAEREGARRRALNDA